MKLSILIPSLESRSAVRYNLLRQIYDQIISCNAFFQVEVKCIIDNKEITTGEKRNQLLDSAIGRYIVFIDDDDEIYEDYLSLILEAIKTNADVIGTQGHYSIDGDSKQLWILSKDFTDHDSNGILYRRANHLSPVKRELALQAKFPHISNAEDKAYSEALNKYLKTETKIDKPIYHYKYSSNNKEYA